MTQQIHEYTGIKYMKLDIPEHKRYIDLGVARHDREITIGLCVRTVHDVDEARVDVRW